MQFGLCSFDLEMPTTPMFGTSGPEINLAKGIIFTVKSVAQLLKCWQQTSTQNQPENLLLKIHPFLAWPPKEETNFICVHYIYIYVYLNLFEAISFVTK